MSDEVLKAQGKIDEISEVGSGMKQDGSPWTRYKYKIGGRYYSGFIDLKSLEPPQKIGDTVIIAYVENPSTNKEGKPVIYKNVRAITPVVSDEEVAESNAAVNMQPVGTPDEPKAIESIDYKTRQEKIQKSITVGMVFNKTVDCILAHEDLTIDKHFGGIFEKLYKLAEGKRKEKLG